MPTFVVGDVHGHREVLVALLRDAGLVDRTERWTGVDARLWLTGDLVDRGPDGVGTIDLIMRLEREGDVRCLLGNHEVMLLGVDRHPTTRLPGVDLTFGELWQLNGGRVADLRALGDEHRAWLPLLPAIACDGEWLLLHADTDRYLELGRTVDAVRASVASSLAHAAPSDLAALLDVVSDRGRLVDDAAVGGLLDVLGGSRIVHGHTPIALVLGVDARAVDRPLVSSDGRVTNVDHCLFGGGRGFVFELPVELPVQRGE